MRYPLILNLYKIIIFACVLLGSVFAFAVNNRATYQAKIIKPDGFPLEAINVNFKFTILDPSASCVLYSEEYTAVNMQNSGGLISFSLGAGNRIYPASGSTTFESVMDNSVVSFPCQTPGLYAPTSADNRKIVMQFNDGYGWQTLPAMAINSVPYAMYAGKSDNAIKLNGKSDAAFVQYSSLASLTCNPVTEAIAFNGASFSCIPVGVSSSGISSVTTSGTVLTTGGTASAPVISITAATMSSDGYLTSIDYAEFKAKLSASSTQIISTLGYAPVSSSAVNTQIQAANLAGDVSGTITANVVQSVGGKTSAQVATSVDDAIAATASSTADTIVKRNSSGNFTANDVYANATKINYVDIYKPSTSFNIRLQAPTSLAANYTLNLPTSSGTVGQVLSTDGSGNLSWISAATGSVTSVSATAPLVSTGGVAPTISITQSTSSTNGYLSSADWNTFNNKQQATSAAIIATLGYTPANDAVSGSYMLKANNLSDLASSALARTNLGLGSFATASTIDLGSVSATGTLAEARLPSFANITSGAQYTKVTVDGKGRVTSGAQLVSSDVTTALGYTPAPVSASTQWITSGSTISYSTGNVGVGTTNPTEKLSVNGFTNGYGLSVTDGGFRTLGVYLNSAGPNGVGVGTKTAYPLYFFTNNNTATAAMLINTSGNVGIGVTAPSTELEVSGTITMSSSSEGISTYVNTGTSYTITNTSLNIRRLTLNGNATVRLPAYAPAGTKIFTITVFVKQDGTGSRTVNFLGNGADAIKWDSGAAPSISTAVNKITILQFTKPSDEAVWYGSKVWQED